MSHQNVNRHILIEPGVKYFLNETLKQCHKFKESHRNTMINIGLLCLLFVVLGIFLLYKYRGKPTKEEIEEKEIAKKHYILSKIRNYQEAKLRSQQELITGLPHWENEIDIMNDSPIKRLQR